MDKIYKVQAKLFVSGILVSLIGILGMLFYPAFSLGMFSPVLFAVLSIVGLGWMSTAVASVISNERHAKECEELRVTGEGKKDAGSFDDMMDALKRIREEAESREQLFSPRDKVLILTGEYAGSDGTIVDVVLKTSCTIFYDVLTDKDGRLISYEQNELHKPIEWCKDGAN